MKKTSKWSCIRRTVTNLNGQYSYDYKKGMNSKQVELSFGDELMEEKELAKHTGNEVTILGKYKYQVYSPNSGEKWCATVELIPA